MSDESSTHGLVWERDEEGEIRLAPLHMTADTLVAYELRMARLEAAVVSLGADLPAFGGVDAVLRQSAAGRLTGRQEGDG